MREFYWITFNNFHIIIIIIDRSRVFKIEEYIKKWQVLFGIVI